MRLALLTYDTCHLKTEQVAMGLQLRGHRQLSVIALPFRPRPARSITSPHRPDMATGASARALARAIDADFLAVGEPAAIPTSGFECYLITGAGLLPAGFVEATKGSVVNAHPGIIPLVRGLDAFKWAIHDAMPLGNTLHLIDAEADAGEVIAIEPTPILAEDSYQQLARRHYEREVQMLIDFERYLQEPRPRIDAATSRPARMRMKAESESVMRDAFQAYKARFAIDRRQSEQ